MAGSIGSSTSEVTAGGPVEVLPSVPSNAEPKDSGVVPAQSTPNAQAREVIVESAPVAQAEWAVSDAVMQAGRRGFVDEGLSAMLRAAVYLREDELQRALRREQNALDEVDRRRSENEELKIKYACLEKDMQAGMQFGPFQQILIGLGGAFLGTGIGMAFASNPAHLPLSPWLPDSLGMLFLLLGVFARAIRTNKR